MVVDGSSGVAVVTGAGRGVGRGIALGLAEHGWQVALLARTGGQISAVAAEIEQGGGHALPLQVDVADQDQVQVAVSTIARDLGPIDLLVNNAGSGAAIGPLWEADAGAWWRDVEVNIRGTFLLCRAVVPAMVERRRGRVVNISSYAATKTSPFFTAYASSKAAIIRLTEGLAASLEPHGVRAFVISPGNVRTAMTEAMMSAPSSPVWFPQIAARKPEEWQSPDAAARLVICIANGEADALSGRFLHVKDDVADLVRRADELRRREQLVLRLTHDL